MQFEIENKVTTTQIVTLDAPAYYKALGFHYFLTDKFLMKVIPRGVASMENGTSNHAMYIQDLVKYGKIITQQEFEIEFNKQIKCLTEQYQSSIHMDIGYIDPGTKQAEDANEQAAKETQGEKANEEVKGAGELVN